MWDNGGTMVGQYTKYEKHTIQTIQIQVKRRNIPETQGVKTRDKLEYVIL